MNERPRSERIFAACREAGTPEPQIRFEAGGLWTEFPFGKAYLNIIRGEVTPKVTGEVTGEVTRLLIVMKNELKRADIQAALGLKHEDHFRAAYLIPALASGLIEMKIPDKPTSSLQKHRITEAGRRHLRAVETKGPPR